MIPTFGEIQGRDLLRVPSHETQSTFDWSGLREMMPSITSMIIQSNPSNIPASSLIQPCYSREARLEDIHEPFFPCHPAFAVCPLGWMKQLPVRISLP